MCDPPTKNDPFTGIKHLNRQEFAGSQTCKSCHRKISDSHSQTAHYLTSRPATPQNVKGSFDEGMNLFVLNRHLKIVMSKNGDSLFQTGYVDDEQVLKEPMDIVIGSGRKGQTYLYWYQNKLFELPVSFYTPLNSWCSSPGYPETQILFNRMIPFRCLECHGTYFKAENISGADEYDRSQMIFGIDCERCHGPAANHVLYQQAHPQDKQARFIINPALLSRQQKLDNCALCHSGLRENIKPSFSFLVGDKLDSFSKPDYNVDSTANLDVHGNQYGLLTSSKCFKMSLTLDCSSCHNTHVNENNLALFSQKCMNCHQPSTKTYCKLTDTTGFRLVDNCVDCHMPELPSKKIFMQVSSSYTGFTNDLVRTHQIKVYRNETDKFKKRIYHLGKNQ